MSSEEQKQILKMLEAGKISADEAMKLIKAIEAGSEEAEIEVIQTESSPEIVEGRHPSSPAQPAVLGQAGLGPEESVEREFEEVKARARRFAMIPLGVGVLLTILASYWLFVLVLDANYGFWFVCAWIPLLLGIFLLALSAGGMNARWLYVNVDQQPGEHPQHITLGFPVPLGLLGWLLKTFGHFIPGMDRQRMEDILALLAMADAHGPLIVNVDEGARGERVQVYIG